MIRRSISGLIIAASLFPMLSLAAPVKVGQWRISARNNEWRLVFNVSHSTNYFVFTLSHPNRLVVDVIGARLTAPLSKAKFLGTPIKDARFAYHKDNRLRMVFDLQSPINYKTFELKSVRNSSRIVIDFKSGTPNLKTVLKYKPLAIKSKPIAVVTVPKSKKRPRNIVVVVDPGHGGKDPGATGPGGTHEKTIVLAIGKILRKIIDRQPGFTAKLTRKGDYYITLRRRMTIARKDKADMFVAIHADKWYNAKANGASVFALSRRGATSEAARWLAARENASELMGGVDLGDKTKLLKSVLINLSQTATIRTSLKIGADIISHMKKITRMHQPYVEQAAFVVLKSPDIPSLLVETGFLSNPNEERKLRSPRYRLKLAKSIMQGIREYFRAQPPPGTWLAYWKKHPRLYGKKVFKG